MPPRTRMSPAPATAMSDLDEPGAFDGVIAVHELDAEADGFSVHHQPITSREAIEGVAAGLLVEVRAGDLDGRFAAGERLCQEIAEHLLAQAGDQDEVALAQQAQGVAQLGAVLVAEV